MYDAFWFLWVTFLVVANGGICWLALTDFWEHRRK